MAYLLIALAVLVIVAPIMAILPSKRQQAVMNLRRQAMSNGLMVDLTRITDPVPDQDKYRTGTGRPVDPILTVIAYRIVRPKPDDRRLHPRVDYALLRQPGGRHPFVDDWCWENVVDVPREVLDRLRSSLPLLPNDVVKVDEINWVVSVYWLETTGEAGLEAVRNFLIGMKGLTYGNGA